MNMKSFVPENIHRIYKKAQLLCFKWTLYNRCRLQKCIFASIFFFCLFYASSNSLFAAAPIKALLKWESLKRSYIHFVRDSLPFHNFYLLYIVVHKTSKVDNIDQLNHLHSDQSQNNYFESGSDIKNDKSESDHQTPRNWVYNANISVTIYL